MIKNEQSLTLTKVKFLGLKHPVHQVKYTVNFAFFEINQYMKEMLKG